MTSDLTQVLSAIELGDADAAERLLPLVYDELRGLAAQRMRNEAPGTLQATALVHEAWLRIVGPDGARSGALFDNRGHFFAAAAESMRRILIERARSRGRLKRGGDKQRVDLDPDQLLLDEVPAELLDLDAALDRLAAEDADKARLVTLRFFAGLTLAEAADALGISQSTADRHWAYAKAYLFDAMNEDD